MFARTIAIVGGTGPQGRGLGYRLARAGHTVILGSRNPDRARSAADELSLRLPASARIGGTRNGSAASVADVVILAVPFASHEDVVSSLRAELTGKIVISCVNPLGFDKQGPYGLEVDEGSAAEQAARILPESTMVAAFHHLSAVRLLSDATWLSDEDVLVCGDDLAAKNVVRELAACITGKPGIDAGGLRFARKLEPLTAVLISINRRYKTHAGVLISGVPHAPVSLDSAPALEPAAVAGPARVP